MISRVAKVDSNLHPDVENGIHQLRGQLAEMLSAVGADARRPQDVSRQLKLDKSLAWKLSKVIGASEPQAVIQHLPGDAALALVVKAVANAGASKALCKRVDDAITNFRTAVSEHVGDKPTLELIVDALPDKHGERLITSRKLAFRGNSGIWGVQADVRVNSVWIAPSKDDSSMIDTATVGGWLGFKRLRDDANWVIFRRRAYTSKGPAKFREEPIDPKENADGPMLLRKFCSKSMPDISAQLEDGTMIYELGKSTVGTSGAFDCFFGSTTRNLGSRYADPGKPDDRGFFNANITAPVTMLQFDLFIHRACLFAFDNLKIQVVGQLGVTPETMRERDILPIAVTRVDLGRQPPVVHSSDVPRYAELVDLVHTRTGWSADEFSGVRFLIEYPPFPSTVIVSFPLESK
ncbi:MAG TPA: hypothetical protein PK402_04345 [Tepidisphaeraceae bacterium]|nr:hypothetical protein [Tepidisphaeraceae bacterium]